MENNKKMSELYLVEHSVTILHIQNNYSVTRSDKRLSYLYPTEVIKKIIWNTDLYAPSLTMKDTLSV